MPPGMAGLADDDISIVDEVKGNLPKMPTLTKAPRSALKGQNSNPMGMGLLQGFGAGSSMQVTKKLNITRILETYIFFTPKVMHLI